MAYTVTKEVLCRECSGTGELHQVDEVREDVVNAFGYKIGTRSVGKQTRIDPCPSCGARGKVRRTERRRVRVASHARPPSVEGIPEGQKEVYEGDCQTCRGRGVLVEGVGPYVRCWHCTGLGIRWPTLLVCDYCDGRGLLDNGWTIYNLEGKR